MRLLTEKVIGDRIYSLFTDRSAETSRRLVNKFGEKLFGVEAHDAALQPCLREGQLGGKSRSNIFPNKARRFRRAVAGRRRREGSRGKAGVTARRISRQVLTS
jgi:hypothetical protein